MLIRLATTYNSSCS